jgi:hypothetical protein
MEIPFVQRLRPFVGHQTVGNYVTWTEATTARRVQVMIIDPDNVNLALARCDLERVIRDHIHKGVLPSRLMGELLEICANLNILSRTQVEEQLSTHGDADEPDESCSLSARPAHQSRNSTGITGLHVKWVKPLP